MKKRVGVIGLMLTAVGLMLQPATAAAADFGRGAQPRVEQRTDAHFVTQYRAPVVNRHNRDRVSSREHSDRRDIRDRGERRVVVVDHFRR